MVQKRLSRKLLVISSLVLAIGCGGNWKVTAHTIGDRTYEALNLASTTADDMVTAKTMTPQQRQQFAKEVMVPATGALKDAVQAVIAWKEGEPVPENVARLVGVLIKAVDSTAKNFGVNSPLHSALIVARNRANGLLGMVQ